MSDQPGNSPVRPEVSSANTWRPIDSAPKDGSEILIYDGFEPFAGSGYWNAEDAEWIGCSRRSALWKQPTHWMPLPEPSK